jgi:hypothetical protein
MNREAVRVALAPFIAFAVAAIVDTLVYYLLGAIFDGYTSTAATFPALL